MELRAGEVRIAVLDHLRCDRRLVELEPPLVPHNRLRHELRRRFALLAAAAGRSRTTAAAAIASALAASTVGFEGELSGHGLTRG